MAQNRPSRLSDGCMSARVKFVPLVIESIEPSTLPLADAVVLVEIRPSDKADRWSRVEANARSNFGPAGSVGCVNPMLRYVTPANRLKKYQRTMHSANKPQSTLRNAERN